MQSRSELPSESRERLETELLLQPISSCIQHFSYCPHCQVSGALSLLRVALAFHTLSPIPWYFPDTSAWKPLPCSFLESTARLPSYHLSDLGHTTSAFQMQEKRGACQFAVRRAKKIRTAGFPLKTSLLSDCGLMPWGRRWGKSKNQKPIQPSLAITFQLFQPVGPFLLTFTVLGIALYSESINSCLTKLANLISILLFFFEKKYPEILKDLSKIPWVSAWSEQFTLGT